MNPREIQTLPRRSSASYIDPRDISTVPRSYVNLASTGNSKPHFTITSTEYLEEDLDYEDVSTN